MCVCVCISEGAANLGYYSQTVNDSQVLYNSTSYFDDLAWGAAWLYKRTGDADYLAQAQVYHAAQLPYNNFSDPGTGLVFDWDNKLAGVSYLLLEASGFRNASYKALVCLTPGDRGEVVLGWTKISLKLYNLSLEVGHAR